jgi:putative aldouronate transport system permease protein
MNLKRSIGERIFDFFNVVFMLLLLLITLYPLLYILFASVSNSTLLSQHQGFLLHPLGFSLDAFKMVFKNPMIPVGYRNTIFYVVCGTTINVFMTALGAFVLSRRKFLFKKFLTFMFVFTMFFSGGLIPFFLTVRSLGITNTPFAILLPSAISTYNLIIMRTSFAALPPSLEESAKIDSANDFVILFKIVIPLCKPVMAVMILFYGVYHWNAWVNAMIFIQDRNLLPLQTILREILIMSSTDNMMTDVVANDMVAISQTIKYAAIIVATVPILCVYPFLQKYFTKGIMIGAIKE